MFSILTGKPSEPPASVRDLVCRSQKESSSRTADGSGCRASRERGRSFLSLSPWRSTRPPRPCPRLLRDDRCLHAHRGDVSFLDALPVFACARTDTLQVVNRFGVLRNPSPETFDRSFAGIVSGQGGALVAETVHQVAQVP